MFNKTFFSTLKFSWTFQQVHSKTYEHRLGWPCRKFLPPDTGEWLGSVLSKAPVGSTQSYTVQWPQTPGTPLMLLNSSVQRKSWCSYSLESKHEINLKEINNMTLWLFHHPMGFWHRNKFPHVILIWIYN